jgi:hypothetical protein
MRDKEVKKGKILKKLDVETDKNDEKKAPKIRTRKQGTAKKPSLIFRAREFRARKTRVLI